MWRRLRCPAGVWSAGHESRVLAGGAVARTAASSFSLTRAVDGGAGDAEQVGKLSGAVFAAVEQLGQMGLLAMIEFGLLVTQAPFRLGDSHAFAGAQPDQVVLSLLGRRVRNSR
jgi:hypothetical protein